MVFLPDLASLVGGGGEGGTRTRTLRTVPNAGGKRDANDKTAARLPPSTLAAAAHPSQSFPGFLLASRLCVFTTHCDSGPGPKRLLTRNTAKWGGFQKV